MASDRCPPCGAHGVCDEALGKCGCEAAYGGSQCDRCATGFIRVDDQCVPGMCGDNGDCNDGNPCNGEETCSVDHICVKGDAVDCGPGGACRTSDGRCDCQAGWSGERCDGCAEGYVMREGRCVIAPCETDTDCDDENPCNGKETCNASGECEQGSAMDCGPNGTCEPGSGRCECDLGYEGEDCSRCADGFADFAGQCLRKNCTTDADCSDQKACNGREVCTSEKVCAPAPAVICGENAVCREPSGSCVCNDGFVWQEQSCKAVSCEMPQAPTLSIIHTGAELTFRLSGQEPLEVGATADPKALEPDTWMDGPKWLLTNDGLQRVFARKKGGGCAADSTFAFTYQVQPKYPPAAGIPGTTAIAKDDPRIVGWATGWVEPVAYGTGVDPAWKTPEKAVGPAQGTSTDIVSLGEGGTITLTFAPPIGNGPGPDFVVFENSFNDTFLELAYVEVSSNGVDFVRFDCAYLAGGSVGGFSGHDSTVMGSLAGSYRQGYGAPFDLDALMMKPEVRSGLIQLTQIRYVRIVDIVGDGSFTDSFGHAIFDPYPTVGSAGFDLDAIGVLHQAP